MKQRIGFRLASVGAGYYTSNNSKAAMRDKNNYVVRVTNHALDQLLGTRSVVP